MAKNGVELGWLIDPIEKRAIIYQQGMREAEQSGFDSSLIGVRPVDGFELKLSQLIMH